MRRPSMARIPAVNPEKAQGQLKDIYQAMQKKMGKVPNIFKLMGNSPAVLKGYVSMSEAQDALSLNPKVRELIALAVSQANQCNYCLSAHSAIGQQAGLAEQDILHAREGKAANAKTQAILTFVRAVVEKRGHLDDAALSQLKTAGVTDAEVVEILFVIQTTMFTNYFNHIFDTEIDFAQAPQLHLAGSRH